MHNCPYMLLVVQVSQPRSLIKNVSSGAGDKQQSGRHLLAAKYLKSTWNKEAAQSLTSYIKLEGVDSIGHVSQRCLACVLYCIE